MTRRILPGEVDAVANIVGPALADIVADMRACDAERTKLLDRISALEDENRRLAPDVEAETDVPREHLVRFRQVVIGKLWSSGTPVFGIGIDDVASELDAMREHEARLQDRIRILEDELGNMRARE